MEKEPPVFADGIRFERPKEGTPEFVKGRLGIHVERFKTFLDAHKDGEWVNLDLLQSKDGKTLYFTLNTWKPKQKGEYPDGPEPKDIPF